MLSPFEHEFIFVVCSVTIQVVAPSGSQLFNSSGTFQAMLSITYRVLVVGGGAGGVGADAGGGGSGFVRTGSLSLTAGQLIAVTVGAGGATSQNGINATFGNLVTAAGGKSAPGYQGGSGGSGAGAGYAYCTSPAAGGANGNNGGAACGIAGGSGQGLYTSLLSIFTKHNFTGGSGGAGGTAISYGSYNSCTGVGGGGVRMDGTGPSAGNGSIAAPYNGKGGVGYGAGGGAGGWDGSSGYAAETGARGMVYVEWGLSRQHHSFIRMQVFSMRTRRSHPKSFEANFLFI